MPWINSDFPNAKNWNHKTSPRNHNCTSRYKTASQLWHWKCWLCFLPGTKITTISHIIRFLIPFILNYTKLRQKDFFRSRGNKNNNPKSSHFFSLKSAVLLLGKVITIKCHLQSTKIGSNIFQLAQTVQLALDPLCFIYAIRNFNRG